jgi:hypothetical protein
MYFHVLLLQSLDMSIINVLITNMHIYINSCRTISPRFTPNRLQTALVGVMKLWRPWLRQREVDVNGVGISLTNTLHRVLFYPQQRQTDIEWMACVCVCVCVCMRTRACGGALAPAHNAWHMHVCNLLRKLQTNCPHNTHQSIHRRTSVPQIKFTYCVAYKPNISLISMVKCIWFTAHTYL